MQIDSEENVFRSKVTGDVTVVRSRSGEECPLSTTLDAQNVEGSLRVTIPQRPLATQLPLSVRIVEVGPRDGLQNETAIVDASVKIDLVHDLADAGLRVIEVTSFVSPKWVPQLADASTVMAAINKKRGVEYPVLVPNLKGFYAATEAGATHVAVFTSASESFSQHNINCSIRESLDRFKMVVSLALSRGIKVRAYVSCIAGCPYEGEVNPSAVARVARELYDMGCYEISLGDTIGVGNPCSVVRVVDTVVAHGVPVTNLAIHCHNTRGAALANVLGAMSRGVAVVDTSIAGLGGCPFAPGAPGNLATEDLVYMLQGMKIDVGPIELDKLIRVGEKINAHLQRSSTSKLAIASRSATCQIGKKRHGRKQ